MATSNGSGGGRSADLLSWFDMTWRPCPLGALLDRHERAIFRADVIGRWADDLAVAALFDDVSGPACGARNHEQRREHLGGYAHHVVADRAEPVKIREQLLRIRHDRLEPFGDAVHQVIARLGRELPGDALDNLIARISNGVHRMTEADDDFLARDPRPHVSLGLIGCRIALLNLEGGLVGAPVLGAA